MSDTGWTLLFLNLRLCALSPNEFPLVFSSPTHLLHILSYIVAASVTQAADESSSDRAAAVFCVRGKIGRAHV